MKAERELLGREARQADVVITTALIPGKPAPLLILEVCKLIKLINKIRL